MPRKATWLILIWTALMIWWVVGGVSSVAPCAPNSSGCQAGQSIGIGIGVTVIFVIWFLGFVVLSIAWFMTRPKTNVVVYGPDGQQVMVSEKEARKRIEKGWRYQPQGRPPG